MLKSVCVREREQEGENIEGKERGGRGKRERQTERWSERWGFPIHPRPSLSFIPVQTVLIMSQSVVVWS